MTRYLRRRSEVHVTSLRRSQPGGPGKHTGRSMKRTMQRREGYPGGIAGRAGWLWVATRFTFEEAWNSCASTTGRRTGPTGVGSTARVESAAAKVGKVSWVA